MEHKTARLIQCRAAFDDADGENIVFFGNYFRLAHRAFEQYVPLLGIPWTEWFANPDWGVPLRHAQADYFQPLRPGQEFTVKIQAGDISESSVQFHYDFMDSNRKLVARLKTSHVFVSRKQRFEKIPIPESVRAILS